MNTPRVATFDDLRVGQWVAWYADDRSYSGNVEGFCPATDPSLRRWAVRDIDGGVGRLHDIYPIDSDMLVILRDAPEPPVKVPREFFDALVQNVKSQDESPATVTYHQSILVSARAVIDNAEVGDE